MNAMRKVLKDFRQRFGTIYHIADNETHNTIDCYLTVNEDLSCNSACAAFNIEGTKVPYVTCWGRKIGKLLKEQLTYTP